MHQELSENANQILPSRCWHPCRAKLCRVSVFPDIAKVDEYYDSYCHDELLDRRTCYITGLHPTTLHNAGNNVQLAYRLK